MAHPGCVWLEKLLQYLGRPTRCMSALHASLVPNQGMRASPSGAGCLQGMLRPSPPPGDRGRAESMRYVRSNCGLPGAHGQYVREPTAVRGTTPCPCMTA